MCYFLRKGKMSKRSKLNLIFQSKQIFIGNAVVTVSFYWMTNDWIQFQPSCLIRRTNKVAKNK